MGHLGASHSIHTRPSFGTWCTLGDKVRAGLFTDPLLCCRYAIKGSPNQKLLLEDIYYAIESRVRVLFGLPFTSSAAHMKGSSHISGPRHPDGRYATIPSSFVPHNLPQCTLHFSLTNPFLRMRT